MGFQGDEGLNVPLLVAGLIAGFAAFVHAIAGEYTDMRHMRSSDMPLNEQIEVRATWHIASITLGLSAILLLVMSFGSLPDQRQTIAQLIAIFYLIGGMVWVGVTLLMRRGMLFKVPQWILLLAIAGLTWWGNL